MKNSFIVRVAVKLTLMKLGVPPGFFLELLTSIGAFFLGAAVDKGIIQLDVTFDGLKEATNVEEFKKQAALEYQRARRKALTPSEKIKVRDDFRRTLEPIARMGRVRDPGT
ncbi:MAG: hypothetical protein ACRCV5_01635 [Afipia sp.]